MIAAETLFDRVQTLLIEPPDAGVTFPSGLWTGAEVAGYLNRRQHQFLKRTALTVAWSNRLVSPSNPVVSLPDDWIALVAAYYRHTTSGWPIYKSDVYLGDHLIPTWRTTAGLPLFLDVQTADTRQAWLIPTPDGTGIAPGGSGILEILYVSLAETVTTGTGGGTLGVPDECMPTLLYGVLEDMLKKVGRAQDLARAAYCARRWEEGIAIAQVMLAGLF